jgi:hypothetical protein
VGGATGVSQENGQLCGLCGRGTHRRDVREARDGAVRVGEEGGDEKVGVPAQDEEGRVGAAAGVRLGEGGGRDGGGDARELADVATGEFDAADVGTRACEVFDCVRV